MSYKLIEKKVTEHASLRDIANHRGVDACRDTHTNLAEEDIVNNPERYRKHLLEVLNERSDRWTEYDIKKVDKKSQEGVEI